MFKKSLIALSCTFIMSLSVVGSTMANSQLSDISESHWANDEINTLYKEGIITTIEGNMSVTEVIWDDDRQEAKTHDLIRYS